MKAPWNSLEIVKLVVSVLTPLVVAIAVFWLNIRLKSLEQAQWGRQKVVERRIKAYDDMAPLLNQLFCFFCYIGAWKELSPPKIVKLKRKLDEIAHISAPLLTRNSCHLTTHCGRRVSRPLATRERMRNSALYPTVGERPHRQEDWDSCFCDPDHVPEPSEVIFTYEDLMLYLAGTIGAEGVNAHAFGHTDLPSNFGYRSAGIVSR
jgi:hypothetical protein